MSDPSSDAQQWEANLLLAERVAGWRWVEGFHDDVSVALPGGGPPRWLLPPHMDIEDVPRGEWTTYKWHEDPDDESEYLFYELTVYSVPRYTQDLAAAWQLLDRFILAGCDVSVDGRGFGHPQRRWSCQIDRGPAGGGVRWESQETPQMAICHAASHAYQQGFLSPDAPPPASAQLVPPEK